MSLLPLEVPASVKSPHFHSLFPARQFPMADLHPSPASGKQGPHIKLASWPLGQLSLYMTMCVRLQNANHSSYDQSSYIYILVTSKLSYWKAGVGV